MRTLQHLAVTLVILGVATGVTAQQAPKHMTPLSAVQAQFPNRNFSVWESAQGDLTGDGVQDVALVVTGENTDKDRTHVERLVVLAGSADGSYSVISASQEFGNVVKFYSLSIHKGALFVQAVFHADAASLSSSTVQFRRNPLGNDFEVIGKEEVTQAYNLNRSYRSSVNYLTGKVVRSRKDGKRYKEISARWRPSSLSRLQDFDGSPSEDAGEPGLYINEDFSVSR